MIKALHKMVYSRTGDVQRNYLITSRIYGILRELHSKVVSDYSKGTVTARHLSGEVKRIPKKLFDYYNGVLYEGVAKGRTDSLETRKLKSEASKRPRKVSKGSRSRSLAATKYSYITPKGFCENKRDLVRLYPGFKENTILYIRDDYKITANFASRHKEFAESVNKKMCEIGFNRIRKKHGKN